MKKKTKANILYLLTHQPNYGKRLVHVDTFVQFNDMYVQINHLYNGMLKLIDELKEYLRHQNQQASLSGLKRIYQKLAENNQGNSTNTHCYKRAFIVLDGVRVVLDLIYTAMNSSDRLQINHHVLNEAMAILREITIFSSDIANQLSMKDELIIYFFALMKENVLFDNASAIVEELFAARTEVFDLYKISNVYELVQSFSCRQLALFCRLLALVVFEPEDRYLMEHSKVLKSFELLKIRRRRMIRKINTIDRNHSLLIGMPKFIPRMIKLLKIQSDAPPAENLPEFVLSQFPSTVDMFLLLGGLDTNSEWNDNDDNHDASRRVRSTAEMEAESRIQAIALAPHQIEVVFVLCTLLGGKRKIDVQDILAKLGLADVLLSMFDRLKWTSPSSERSFPVERLHGNGCECNPDAALRVQYLRLIHNFCDRDKNNRENKYLLLSQSEKELLQDKHSLIQWIPDMNDENNGLLYKIINVLLNEPSDSGYRFWLVSCVEVFLRGASHEEQVFVGRTPLMRFLLNEILNDGFHCNGNLQTAFDLLGELVKENDEMIDLFLSYLNDVEFSKFMNVVISNLVDSNVFIRSVLLSVEKNSSILAIHRSSNRLFLFFQENMVKLLSDLTHIITIFDINHENICCLNTSLIIFIFAHRQQQIPLLLGKLREASEGAMTSFRKLLWFWKEYYLYRGRDRLSLECSSHIPFREWNTVISLLSADDGSPTSLLNSPILLPISPNQEFQQHISETLDQFDYKLGYIKTDYQRRKKENTVRSAEILQHTRKSCRNAQPKPKPPKQIKKKKSHRQPCDFIYDIHVRKSMRNRLEQERKELRDSVKLKQKPTPCTRTQPHIRYPKVKLKKSTIAPNVMSSDYQLRNYWSHEPQDFGIYYKGIHYYQQEDENIEELLDEMDLFDQKHFLSSS